MASKAKHNPASNKLINESGCTSETGGQVNPVAMRYFGHATFAEYHASASRRGHALEGLTCEQAWERMMSRLGKRGAHITSAEWIRDELARNPAFMTRPIWYWVMPETRALVPVDLLASVDACGAGIA